MSANVSYEPDEWVEALDEEDFMRLRVVREMLEDLGFKTIATKFGHVEETVTRLNEQHQRWAKLRPNSS